MGSSAMYYEGLDGSSSLRMHLNCVHTAQATRMLVDQLRKAGVIKLSMTSWESSFFISHYQLF